MHIRIKANTVLFLAAMASFAGIAASAQSVAPGEPKPSPELAIDYNYVHSNAPPGDCGCINLNGGSATFAWPLGKGTFAIVGDIGATHAGSISSENNDLTLSTYTAGARYSPRFGHWGHARLQPFGQVLVGVAHTDGSLVSTTSNSGAAFASLVGGGLDLRATHRFSFRLFEADYLVTTFDNGDNDHQNNLRIAAGLVLHF